MHRVFAHRSDTDLTGAILDKAILDKAILDGANLTGTKRDPAQSPVWPNGLTLPTTHGTPQADG